MGPEVVRVLRGVSLTVNPGESVAVIGASGVGKSTLLHLLGALDHPSGGRVLFAGEDMYSRSETALARLRRTEVGYVFQFYNLLGEMTALENAMMPALLQRAPWNEARERARRPSARSACPTVWGTAGNSRRGAAARGHCPALVGAPRVILADEPTGTWTPRRAR